MVMMVMVLEACLASAVGVVVAVHHVGESNDAVLVGQDEFVRVYGYNEGVLTSLVCLVLHLTSRFASLFLVWGEFDLATLNGSLQP